MSEYQNSYSKEEINETESSVIPIIEEKVVIGKHIVETGKVIVSKRVSEHEKTIDEPLLREEVSVERVKVNQFIETHPETRQEGDVLIVPVVEEQIVLQKRLFLVEELHIRKQVTEAHQPQQVTLRKEEVDVRRAAASEIDGK